jgi:hypothetical protein
MYRARSLSHYVFRVCRYVRLSILLGAVEQNFLRALRATYQTPRPASSVPCAQRSAGHQYISKGVVDDRHMECNRELLGAQIK